MITIITTIITIIITKNNNKNNNNNNHLLYSLYITICRQGHNDVTQASLYVHKITKNKYRIEQI